MITLTKAETARLKSLIEKSDLDEFSVLLRFITAVPAQGGWS